MADSSKKSAHVLLIPYPASGHILPLMDLAHQLLNRGLTITILVTPKNLHYLTPLISLHTESNVQPLVFPFPNYPSIPHGVENLQDVTVAHFADMVLALGELKDPLIDWFRTHKSPPVAILCDDILGIWTLPLSISLDVKLIAYSALSAHTVEEIFISATVDTNPSPFMVDTRKVYTQSWGMVFNSFNDLEAEKYKVFEKTLNHTRVWGVGPLVPISTSGRGGSSSVSVKHVMGFLDSCETDRSVVYVGFGTQINLKKQQMEVLADGLERSGVKFIWGVKNPLTDRVSESDGEDEGVVPLGFEDRVAGRGIVIRGWAPQAAILEHKAIGAYLSHCGWNSVLEGLRGGVILLAWPMQVDHFSNTKLFADKLGVSIRVCEGLEAVPDLEKLIGILRDSVNGCEIVRKKLMDLRKRALDAIEEGGSSYQNLDSMVAEISKLSLL